MIWPAPVFHQLCGEGDALLLNPNAHFWPKRSKVFAAQPDLVVRDAALL
jgi:hypothetical protein